LTLLLFCSIIRFNIWRIVLDRQFLKIRRLKAQDAKVAIKVETEGIFLGSDCVLVRKTAGEYSCVSRDEAVEIQALALDERGDPDWLFRQCCRMVQALSDGQLALAQIYAIQIPVRELTDAEELRLAAIGAAIKANFNPNQPRDTEGRWTDNSDTAARPSPTSDAPSPEIPNPELAADNQCQNKMVRDIVVQLSRTLPRKIAKILI
jgi:hypothetical protein